MRKRASSTDLRWGAWRVGRGTGRGAAPWRPRAARRARGRMTRARSTAPPTASGSAAGGAPTRACSSPVPPLPRPPGRKDHQGRLPGPGDPAGLPRPRRSPRWERGRGANPRRDASESQWRRGRRSRGGISSNVCCARRYNGVVTVKGAVAVGSRWQSCRRCLGGKHKFRSIFILCKNNTYVRRN